MGHRNGEAPRLHSALSLGELRAPQAGVMLLPAQEGNKVRVLPAHGRRNGRKDGGGGGGEAGGGGQGLLGYPCPT